VSKTQIGAFRGIFRGGRDLFDPEIVLSVEKDKDKDKERERANKVRAILCLYVPLALHTALTRFMRIFLTYLFTGRFRIQRDSV
jgi:hypothetical protein